MSSNYDEMSEQEFQEQKLFEFYQIFSMEIRKKLLSKNVNVIHNVYDVLYPKTKEHLLSKNNATKITIDSTADSIRNALVVKLIEETIDLEKSSENFRKSLLARNELAQTAIDLQEKTESIRKDLLARNKPTINNFDEISDQQRNKLLKDNIGHTPTNTTDAKNEEYRENNLHKNIEKTSNIDTDSVDFRKNNTHKNISSTSDLLIDSDHSRQEDIAKNVSKSGDLLTDSKQIRLDDLAKNTKSTSDLLIDSKESRIEDLSKNASISSDLLRDSKETRIEDLSKNKKSEGDLLTDSKSTREEDLSKNKPSVGDLFSDSIKTREEDLSKNKPSIGDLFSDSIQIREDDLSKNKPSSSDLFIDSAKIRVEDLSKNKPSSSDLLADSQKSREGDLSKNKPSASDLLTDSKGVRADDLSKNKPSSGDLLNDSKKTRTDDLSKNKPSASDLLTDSQKTRVDDLSKNKPSASDLLNDSKKVRVDDLSKNKPSKGDLLTDSKNTREDDLSKNKPSTSDLLTDSKSARENLLSTNIPDTGNLLTDSQVFLNNNVSVNTPGSQNIDAFINEFGHPDTAVAEKNSLLAHNVPNTNSIDTFINQNGIADSAIAEKNSLLAHNVPNTNSIDTFINQNGITDTAVGEKNSLLAHNTPSTNNIDTFINQNGITDSAIAEKNSLLAHNTPSTNNIDTFINQAGATDTAVGEKNSLLAHNTPSTNNIDTFINQAGATDTASGERDSLVSKNTSSPLSVDNFVTTYGGATTAKSYRNSLLSQNPEYNLGVVVEGVGTATYVGISKVLTQGLVIRSFLMAKNRPTTNTLEAVNSGNIYTNVQSNDYTLSSLFPNAEYDRSETNSYLLTLKSADGKDLLSYNPSDINLKAGIEKQLNALNNNNTSQLLYGIDSPSANVNQQNTLLGGSLGVSVKTFTANGSRTDDARMYNLSKNLYNMNHITPGTTTDLAGKFNGVTDAGEDVNGTGFANLIHKTVGSFHTSLNSIGIQTTSSSHPSGVFGPNGYTYLRDSAEKILRAGEPTTPSENIAWMKTPESLMAKTIPGNPLQEVEFDSGRRGVKYVINQIRSKKDGFVVGNPQRDTEFTIGISSSNNGGKSRQRWTMANPYKAPTSRALIFSLKNYSSGDQFYFPPYIESFQDSHNANWNEIHFLGRPEPIFTYNNSTREGSITFFVLTDFTQNFVIGSDYSKPTMDPVAVSANKRHFSNSNSFKNSTNKLAGGTAVKEAKKNSDDLAAGKAHSDVANTNSNNVSTDANPGATGNNPGETAGNQQAASSLGAQNNLITSSLSSIGVEGNTESDYNNSSSKNGNIYTFMTDNTSIGTGEVITNPMDTKNRIDQMVSKLAFQPAYFSGDKLDFVTRMDFLAKLTKPARADKGSGFSFTKPPVAHIKLGDWWDHDIVIKSVSVDYKESPWALDEGRVQPMWASVSLQFSFIGPFGGESSPVLSDDIGGIYSPRQSVPGTDTTGTDQ